MQIVTCRTVPTKTRKFCRYGKLLILTFVA
nr:MAG TPA: DNA topoisomerase small subunit, 30S, translation, bypassing [Bacteriophage sp.]